MGKKILIVDDNSAHNEVMVSLFTEFGYTNVVVAQTGKEGLELFKAENPDLVILDTLLPDTTGFDVCKEITASKATPQPKIIIMTGFIDAVDVIKARQMGADDYVVKTADFSYLLDVVKKLIG
jgi:two-component system alkaline phosphatase synthesis response regulator PhoP/two-component system response regulator VicR